MEFEPILVATFWSCFALVVYAYIVYPLVIRVLSRRFGREELPPVVSDDELPSLSVLIAAHNEQAVIGETLSQILAMDYPAGKLEVVVASDGSTDRTAAVVRGCANCRVRLIEFPVNRGKAAVLNASFPELTGDVVLLTDANTALDPLAARRLVRWFRRPEVGTVCGRLILTDPRTGLNVDSLYWKYETFLKRCEARLGALLGANGAIYAIRRNLFTPIPDGTIVDDFVIPLVARLQTGCANLYDSEAIATEDIPPGLSSEFRRRARIGAGAFQSLKILWRMFDPHRGWVAFTFVSHKLLRWLCPFFLIGMLAVNIPLLGEPLYRATLLVQVSAFLASLLAPVVPARLQAFRPLRLATMFTTMNVALLLGFVFWVSGSQSGTWRHTDRVQENAALDPALGGDSLSA